MITCNYDILKLLQISFHFLVAMHFIFLCVCVCVFLPPSEATQRLRCSREDPPCWPALQTEIDNIRPLKLLRPQITFYSERSEEEHNLLSSVFGVSLSVSQLHKETMFYTQEIVTLRDGCLIKLLNTQNTERGFYPVSYTGSTAGKTRGPCYEVSSTYPG